MEGKKTQLIIESQISHDSESESQSSYQVSEPKPSQRLPEMWTRVKFCDHNAQQRITVFDIDKDLMSDKPLRKVRELATQFLGRVLFDPDTYKGNSELLKYDKWHLGEDELYNYALRTTAIRRKFKSSSERHLEESKDMAEAQSVNESYEVGSLKRYYSKPSRQSNLIYSTYGPEHNEFCYKRQRRTLSQIDSSTRLKIVEALAKKTNTHKEIGFMFNVQPRLVSLLSSDIKRKRPTILKRKSREQNNDEKTYLVAKLIDNITVRRQNIWSVGQIQKRVKEQFGIKIKCTTVRAIMKRQCQLSYRKIKRVPFQGNLERNVVLRSLYARQMLDIYESEKRVINVDESWIPYADFRRRRWKKRGQINTAPDKTLSQKINIITALSSDGDVWIALTTCNTDSNVLMLFMTHLSNELTKKYRDWRSNTVFLLDGVSLTKLTY